MALELDESGADSAAFYAALDCFRQLPHDDAGDFDLPPITETTATSAAPASQDVHYVDRPLALHDDLLPGDLLLLPTSATECGVHGLARSLADVHGRPTVPVGARHAGECFLQLVPLPSGGWATVAYLVVHEKRADVPLLTDLTRAMARLRLLTTTMRRFERVLCVQHGSNLDDLAWPDVFPVLSAGVASLSNSIIVFGRDVASLAARAPPSVVSLAADPTLADLAVTELDDAVRLRAVRPTHATLPTRHRRYWHRLHAVWRSGSDKTRARLIADLRPVNALIPAPPTFTLPSFLDAFRLDDMVCGMKTDLTSAFWTLRMSDRAAAAMSFAGPPSHTGRWEWKGMPFGLTWAPYIFHYALEPLVAFLRARGHSVLKYLDDFLFTGTSHDACVAAAAEGLHHLREPWALR